MSIKALVKAGKVVFRRIRGRIIPIEADYFKGANKRGELLSAHIKAGKSRTKSTLSFQGFKKKSKQADLFLFGQKAENIEAVILRAANVTRRQKKPTMRIFTDVKSRKAQEAVIKKLGGRVETKKQLRGVIGEEWLKKTKGISERLGELDVWRVDPQSFFRKK